MHIFHWRFVDDNQFEAIYALRIDQKKLELKEKKTEKQCSKMRADYKKKISNYLQNFFLLFNE